jgi:hypothetical protein
VSNSSRDCRKDPDRLDQLLAEQTCMALVGDVSGSLAHECNNFLNMLLLQVAVLELELPQNRRSSVEEIRRQGNAFKTLVHYFQSYRQQFQPKARQVDLNHVVQEAIEDMSRPPFARLGRAPNRPSEGPLSSANPALPSFDPSPEVPPLRTSESDLKRLVLLLLITLAGGSDSSGLAIRTEAVDGKVLLRVDIPRARDQVPPAGNNSARTGSLEWAACQSLARRLQGKIHTEDRESDRQVVVVELPAS